MFLRFEILGYHRPSKYKLDLRKKYWPLAEEIQSGFEMRNSLLLSEWQGMTLGLEGRHLHWNAPGTYKHLNSFIELYWQKNESECSICHNRKKGRSRVGFFVDWDIVHKC